MTRKGNYATTPGSPCKGGCGKALRPARAKAADFPGTVRDYGHGHCGACRGRKDRPNAVPRPAREDSFRPHCVECGIALRRQGVSKDEEPDTVKHRGDGKCFRCFDATPTPEEDPMFDIDTARRHLDSWLEERRARIRDRRAYPVGDVLVLHNPRNDVAVVTRDGNPLGAALGLSAGMILAEHHAGPARTMGDLIPGMLVR